MKCSVRPGQAILGAHGAQLRPRVRCVVCSATEDASETRLNDGTGGRGGLKKGGLVQLVQMGLGTIAGDIKEINLSDPRRTVVMELEANNFEDAEGKPLNFIDDKGYVDEKSGSSGGLILAVVLGAVVLVGMVATLRLLA